MPTADVNHLGMVSLFHQVVPIMIGPTNHLRPRPASFVLLGTTVLRGPVISTTFVRQDSTAWQDRNQLMKMPVLSEHMGMNKM